MGGEYRSIIYSMGLDTDGLGRMASRAKTKVSRRRMRVRWQSMPVTDKSKMLEEDGGIMEVPGRQKARMWNCT